MQVDTPAGRFEVQRAGAGPALVLLHSMAASAWSWSRSIPRLEQHFSVYAPDFLGHGQSEGRRDCVSVEHHAGSIEALLATVGVGRFYLSGAALGALVAIELARRNPDRVQGLLLLGTPAFPSAQSRGDWLANRAATFVDAHGLAAPMDEATVFARFKHHEPDLVERFNQERTQAGLWALHDIWAIGTYDSADKARALRVPTTIAYGSSDPFLPGRPALMSATSQVQHLLLDGVGHYPAWDVPERVTDLLLHLAA